MLYYCIVKPMVTRPPHLNPAQERQLLTECIEWIDKQSETHDAFRFYATGAGREEGIMIMDALDHNALWETLYTYPATLCGQGIQWEVVPIFNHNYCFTRMISDAREDVNTGKDRMKMAGLL